LSYLRAGAKFTSSSPPEVAMRTPIATVFFLSFTLFSSAQTERALKETGADASAVATASPSAPAAATYVVLGATPHEESLIRAQVEIIQPAVLPLRVVFVPHWKYVDNTRVFQLHIPKGYTSAMFTHLPSRTIFIDAGRYVSEESLTYWVAHELGHLATNSPKESDAEKIAHEYRKRIRNAQRDRQH